MGIPKSKCYMVGVDIILGGGGRFLNAGLPTTKDQA